MTFVNCFLFSLLDWVYFAIFDLFVLLIVLSVVARLLVFFATFVGLGPLPWFFSRTTCTVPWVLGSPEFQ